jgi:DNA-binding beta-propeller fold protein YncE
VGHFADDKVLRVDPASGAVTASRKVCSGPQDTVALEDVVWVACTFSDEVVGLDPKTLKVTTRVEVTGAPDPIVGTDDGRVFVVAEEGPTVHELDPVTGEILWSETLSDAVALFDNANVDAAVAGGEIWVSSVSHEGVFHIPLP